MKQVLRFLRSLSLHNDKVWFEAHKAEYLAAKTTVGELAAKLIEGIRSFDDTIGPLSVADCTYRIYRDVRFSKDKSPYKTHMGIFMNRGGKKSGYSGYYFHVDGSGDHLLAMGNYFTEPKVLKTLREDIELGAWMTHSSSPRTWRRTPFPSSRPENLSWIMSIGQSITAGKSRKNTSPASISDASGKLR